MIKAVLFDLDGTLVDSNEAHVNVWLRVLAEAGHPFPREVVHDQIGKGADMLVPTLIPGSSEDEAKRLGERHGKVFKAEYLGGIGPLPGARALVERVHGEGKRVVLASSASQSEVDHYVEVLGIGAFIDAMTTADDVEHSKPAPDIFLTALSRVAGVEAGEAVVIGDSPYDMLAARTAGIMGIGLLSGGFAEGQLRDAGAGEIYADAADLTARYASSPLAA